MPGTFSPPPTSKETASWRSRHASLHVRDARSVMHVGIANPRWRGKRPRHSRRMRNPQVYLSGKRPMHFWHRGLPEPPTLGHEKLMLLPTAVTRASTASVLTAGNDSPWDSSRKGLMTGKLCSDKRHKGSHFIATIQLSVESLFSIHSLTS